MIFKEKNNLFQIEIKKKKKRKGKKIKAKLEGGVTTDTKEIL